MPRVEKALAVRQIPDASVTRVDWKEGGLLSARREYLRVQRERFVLRRMRVRSAPAFLFQYGAANGRCESGFSCGVRSLQS